MYIRQHWNTISRHRRLVRQYCFRVGLYRQGLLHDLSKYSWTEFSVGARYWQGNRSPNNAEREATGVSLSWLHHKGRNKHHYEYWVDYGVDADTVLVGMPMPRRYIAEMVMDRISACQVYMGDSYTDEAPYAYYEKGRAKLWFIHEKTDRELGLLLKMLAVKGEDYMLRYVKHYYLKGGPMPWERKK